MKMKTINVLFFRIRQVFLILICLVLVVAVVPVRAAAQTENKGKVVKVGWFESSYNKMDEAGRRSGYTYEYQRKIAAYTGWTYEYVEDSWSGLMQKLIDGEIDMLSDVSYTEERAEKLLFPTYEMGTEEYYIYISADKIDEYQEDYSYFNEKKIGVNKGTVQIGMYHEWAKANHVNAELVEVTTSEAESMAMLNRGELDAYITLDNYLSIDTIIPVAKVGFSNFYLAVTKLRPDLLEELNDAMSKIQDENRFYSQELFSKYIRSYSANLFLSMDEKNWLSGHNTIRVGYQDNYLAYCASDPKTGKLTGALKDYLEKAANCMANAQLKFSTTAYPTMKDTLDALKNGEVDCVFPANFSDYDGEKTGLIITPAMSRAELYTVVRSDDKTKFAQKEQVTAAVVRDDINYESLMLDYFPDWEMIECEDAKDCLRAVSEGRADCFIISSYRYNNLSKLCEDYGLTTLDTGRNIDFSFAVCEGEYHLYSILVKTINSIPDTYIETALTRYFSEDAQSKTTLLDFIRENLFVVIAVLVVIFVMLLLIIVQNRLIKAERKAKENRRIADDLSRRVYVDALTSVRNKGGYSDYIRMLQERLESKEITEFAVCMFDCDDLKFINDKYGHDKGDEYLKTAARLICRIFRNSPVFRIGGDEFASILQGEDYQNREELICTFLSESKTINEAARNEWEHINVSVGMAQFDPQTDHSVEDTACRADQLMYDNKRERKAGRSVR